VTETLQTIVAKCAHDARVAIVIRLQRPTTS
jgi:hypothetical protein